MTYLNFRDTSVVRRTNRITGTVRYLKVTQHEVTPVCGYEFRFHFVKSEESASTYNADYTKDGCAIEDMNRVGARIGWMHEAIFKYEYHPYKVGEGINKIITEMTNL